MKPDELLSHLNNNKITEATGKIIFNFLNINSEIKSLSVIGDIIQNWLNDYLFHHNISFQPPPHSQVFPDFYLQDNDIKYLLEIKCYNSNAAPNFDIANFESYVQSVLENPTRLDSYYLIFGYKLNSETNELSIKNVWLKRVWEICRSSERYSINTNVKKGSIHNIRPATWFAKKAKFQTFQNLEEFLMALWDTIRKYPQTDHLRKADWINKVKVGYLKAGGINL